MTLEGLFLLVLHPENAAYIEMLIMYAECSTLNMKKIIQDFSDSNIKKHRHSDIDTFITYSYQDSIELTHIAINSKGKKLLAAWVIGNGSKIHDYKKLPPYLEKMIVSILVV